MTKQHVLGTLQVTRRCNQDCLFCSAPHHPFDLKVNEINHELDRMKDMGGTDLMFTGGEPTLRPDLPGLVRLALSKGFEEVSIQTNGSNLDDDLVKALLASGRVKFDISFHTHRKDVFERLTKGSFERFIRGLECIKRHGANAYYTTVIHSLNYRSLKEQVMFSQKHFPNIRHFSFNFVDPTNNALNNKWIVPRLSDAANPMAEAFRHILDSRMSFRIEFVPLCFIKDFAIYSSEVDREYLGDESYSGIVNLTDRNVEVNRRGNRYLGLEQCKACDLRGICGGLSSNYARIHGTSEPQAVETHEGLAICKVNNVCNSNCLFCADNREARARDSKTWLDLKKELIMARTRASSLILTGGEPTIYPKILQLVKFAKETCLFKSITVCSNGLMLSYPNFVQKLVMAGTDTFQLSFHTLDEKKCERIMQVRGASTLIEKAIANVRDQGARLNVNVVMTRLNIDEIPSITKHLRGKADHLQLSMLNPCNAKGMALRYPEIALALQQSTSGISVEGLPLCIRIPPGMRRSEHPKMNKDYYATGKRKASICSSCLSRHSCEGAWETQLKLFGEEGLNPVHDKLPFIKDALLDAIKRKWIMDYPAEWAGLIMGHKKCALFYAIPDEAKGLISFANELGFEAAQSDFYYGYGDGTDKIMTEPMESAYTTVYVGRDAGQIKEIMELDRFHHLDNPEGRQDQEAFYRIATLLGYPRCCSEFLASHDIGDNEYTPRVAAYEETARHDSRLNNFTGTRLISHFVCRYDCPRSLELAEKTLEFLGAIGMERKTVDSILAFSYWRMFHIQGHEVRGKEHLYTGSIPAGFDQRKDEIDELLEISDRFSLDDRWIIFHKGDIETGRYEKRDRHDGYVFTFS